MSITCNHCGSLMDLPGHRLWPIHGRVTHRAKPRAVLCFSKTSIQQTKFGHSVRGSDEDLAAHDQWRDELVAIAEMIAAGRSLIAVVKLTQICGVVGVQHSGRGILHGPDDAVRGSIRTDRRRSAGILESVRAMERGRWSLVWRW